MNMIFNVDKVESREQNTIIKSINYLYDKYNFATLKDTDKLYYYDSNNGIFVDKGDIFIKSELAAMHTYIPTNQVNEVINTIKYKTYTDKEEFDSKIEWIVCENCIVNLVTEEIREHSPDFMATINIPVIYNKDATCPKIMKFLFDVCSSRRDVETILDFMGYCLWREMKFQKFLILNGEGRNGKSTLCGLITALLGRDNVASESLDQLLESKFSTSQLNKKLANIDADISKTISKKIGMLKKLTGNDRISAEEKYKPQFNFTNYAKIILVANQLPEIEEDTIAIFSRLLIIDFSKTFIKNANPDMIKELTTEEELSGLLNILLKRLSRVLKHGISYSKSVKEISEKYLLRINSVQYFANNFLEKIDDGKVRKDIIYNKYKSFCYKNRIPPKSEYKFSQEMVKLSFKYKQLRDEGYRQYYWINIRLKK